MVFQKAINSTSEPEESGTPRGRRRRTWRRVPCHYPALWFLRARKAKCDRCRDTPPRRRQRRGRRKKEPRARVGPKIHLAGGAGRKHLSRLLGSTAGGLGHSDGGLLVFLTSKYPENTALVPWCPAARETHQKRPRTGSTHSAIAQANHPPPLNDAAYAPLAQMHHCCLASSHARLSTSRNCLLLRQTRPRDDTCQNTTRLYESERHADVDITRLTPNTSAAGTCTAPMLSTSSCSASNPLGSAPAMCGGSWPLQKRQQPCSHASPSVSREMSSTRSRTLCSRSPCSKTGHASSSRLRERQNMCVSSPI